MFTETALNDAQCESNAQDLVRIELIVPRYGLENRTITQLREQANHSEQELRVIGLLDYLAERLGYHYGPELLHPLLQSMDDDCEEFAVTMLIEELQDLRGPDSYQRMYNAA